MHRRPFLAALLATAANGFTPLPATGQSSRRATGYIRTNWSRDPFSLGSYSFIAKGARKRQTRDLARPIADRIFFAGEATHPDYNSTVHAAYESGQYAADAVSETQANRIAVIGAGVSGLAAARQLADAGKAVTVLEGRDRIGGRIWTDNRLGTPMDLGASWIHGTTGNPIARLTRSARIKTKVTGYDYVIRGPGGQRIRDRDAPDWLDEVSEIQQGFGAGSDEINMRAYAKDLDYDGDEVIFPGGYGQILPGLAAGLDVRLGRTATKISLSGDGVSITSAQGGADRYDAVIVTVPLGVLKAGKIAFDPPLPAAKQQAIQQLGMGLLDKVYLKYDEVFWDKDATWILTPQNGLPAGQFNQWLNLYPFTGAPIILAFNGAGPARQLAKLPDAKIVETAQRVLQETYPA